MTDDTTPLASVPQQTTAPGPLLRVENLTVDFTTPVGHTAAVKGVSLDVRPGEVLALVGESGSGKSVTARAVLGLLPETATVSGTIDFDGTDLLAAREADLRAIRGAGISMVFQEPSTALNPVETVGWQITEALRAHRKLSRRQARARAIELLTLVDIPDPETRVDSYPHQLSGGQRQRVAIALALANEPRLIIADEPTTALDVTVQAEILHLLRRLRDRLGMAVLLITHNMGVVADLSDRVVVLRHGVVEEVGQVGQIFTRPGAAYTRELLGSVPRLDAVPTQSAEVRVAGAEVIDFRNLAVDYPGRFGDAPFRALQDVTLQLGTSEVLGLVGESGSGKSTLGRVAVGLLRPAAGSATVLGSPLERISRADLGALRRRVGLVFQDPAASLDPRMTVGDSIAEPLRIAGRRDGPELRRRVDQLLSSVHLPTSYAARRPIELSGGQRQRVALARAIALDPELLVADEPTSALDVTVQAAVLELFRELQRSVGFACIFISHDLAVVDEVADRVAVLRAGRVVEQGTPSVVLRSPSDPYTRRLIDAVPVPDPDQQAARRRNRQLAST